MQPAGVAAQDLAELVGAEAERLRAEVRELGRRPFGREEPDARPLLPRVLRQDELRAACELQPERRCLRAGLARAERLQPAGGHQVHEQHELAVVGREEQPLPAALGPAEPAALELRERRIERLQGRDVRRPGLRDRERGHRVIQPAPPRLHLR